MNAILGDPQQVLNRLPGGFHQYILDEPAHLAFASESFCAMTGQDREKLLSSDVDGFAACVHPQDRQIYAAHLRALSAEECTNTSRYRIVRPDGTVLHVQDSAVSVRLADGRLAADAYLADITPVMQEAEGLRFLNDNIPCGFVRYTCEQAPKITYISDQMLHLMRFPEVKDGEFDYLEMYRSNIYLFVPMEDRKRFAGVLERVRTEGAPISGEMTLLRCDGTRARVYGWVTKSVNAEGEEEFQSVCMDVTEGYRSEKMSESQRYLKALTKIYDKIFEYDFSAGTVKCLYGQNSGVFKWLQNIPMHMHEAVEKWIRTSVLPADQEHVRELFASCLRMETADADGQPRQIRYRALSSDGSVKNYSGIFLKIDRNVSYFCCRSESEEISEAHDLRTENDSLRSMNENMQELVMRFTDGIVAFEIENGRVKPLYASDNVCGFFGYSKEEWIRMAQSSHSIRDFVAKSEVHYEEFMTLLESGEAEFEYLDLKTNMPKRIRAVCSHMFSGDASRQYVLLYNAQQEREAEPEVKIYIRTFGYFDVFVDEKPIAFRNEKSKELFALLVDRRGGYISSEEAIGYLWEDEPVNAVTLARYRKVALRLKNILEEYGISEIVESVNGRRRLVLEKVRCDLTEYLSGKDEYAQLFKGSYLSNYSWAETTLGELLGEHA